MVNPDGPGGHPYDWYGGVYLPPGPDDWPDLRDDATRGAVRGWLSDRAGYPVEFSIDRLEAMPVRYLYRPQSERSLPDWREAEARALLALAREVLA